MGSSLPFDAFAITTFPDAIPSASDLRIFDDLVGARCPDNRDGRYILIDRARNSDIQVFPKSSDAIQPDCSARPLSSPVVPLLLVSFAVSMCHSSASGKLLGWRTLRTA